MKVIPAVIADTFEELQVKIKQVELYVDWVQVDVVDGVFAPRKTWSNPADLQKLNTSISLEAHLMITEPEKHLDEWLRSGVKRILVHVNKNMGAEVVSRMVARCKEAGVEFGVALSPDVSVADIVDVIPLAGVVLVLAVNPGFSGQQFQESALEKIKELRRQFPDITIEVDGGINAQTALVCAQAGADTLISASYIFDSPDIKKAIETLQNA